MTTYDEDTSDAPAGFELSVRPKRLVEFVDLMRREIDLSLLPHAERVNRGLSAGVSFGARSLSSEVQALRIAYEQCLSHSMDITRYIAILSEELVAGIAAVADEYESVDATAAERNQRIGADLAMGWCTAEQTAGQRYSDIERAEAEEIRQARIAEVAARHARIGQDL